MMVLLFVVAILASCQRIDEAYYENGNKKYEIPYEDGEIHGTARYWWENGKMMQLVEYRAGILDGKSIRWYEHGPKQSEEHYKNGLKEGVSIEWDQTGKKLFEQHYENDTLHGLSTHFYPSQVRKVQGQYNRGMMDGQWIYWDDIGNVISSGEFNMGTGVQKHWNANGDLIKTTPFKNNLRHGEEKVYQSSGEVTYVIVYEEGVVVEEQQK
jgi:antitoxin component YwqK of YwqJK toxin-antitoxin module